VADVSVGAEPVDLRTKTKSSSPRLLALLPEGRNFDESTWRHNGLRSDKTDSRKGKRAVPCRCVWRLTGAKPHGPDMAAVAAVVASREGTRLKRVGFAGGKFGAFGEKFIWQNEAAVG